MTQLFVPVGLVLMTLSVGGCAGAQSRIYLTENATLIPYGCQAPDLAVLHRRYVPQFRTTVEQDTYFLFGRRTPTVTSLDDKPIPAETSYIAISNGPHTATLDNKNSVMFVAIAPFIYAAPEDSVIQLGLQPSFIKPNCE